MSRIGKGIVAATVIGLAATTAAFANDAYRLQDLNMQKEAEADSTISMKLGDEVRPRKLTVIGEPGRQRAFGMLLVDMRAVRNSPALRTLTPATFIGSQEEKANIEKHPVVRIDGILDCRSGSVRWKGIGYADGMSTPSAIMKPFRHASATRSLPGSLGRERTYALCDLPAPSMVMN